MLNHVYLNLLLEYLVSETVSMIFADFLKKQCLAKCSYSFWHTHLYGTVIIKSVFSKNYFSQKRMKLYHRTFYSFLTLVVHISLVGLLLY